MATARNGGRGRARSGGAGSRAASPSRSGAKKAERARRAPARAAERIPEPATEVESAPLPQSSPEPLFAARVPPPAPERPRPTARRAIFLDVENASRAQHLAHVIDHLAVNRADSRTDLVAVANWKVVGHDAARLLAQRGAHLVHSAPSTGVRDWSDLRIAVAAGIWLAAARAGDLVEIVSDDRAFDAVGDVAASLGIRFRRLSYRQLAKVEVDAAELPAPRPEPGGEARGRRRRRRGGRGRSAGSGTPRIDGRERPSAPARPPRAPLGEPGGRPRVHPAPPAPVPGPGAHTAPHDEIVSVVRELVDTSPGRQVSIDALANVLKSRGFRRPPGSPRLMTRLRRIREIVVSSSGVITLAGDGHEGRERPAGEGREPEPEDAGPAALDDAAEEAEAEAPGSAESPAATAEPARGRRRRRRRRRGGHRRPPPSQPPA
jgi:hypothetical protein